MAKTNLVLALIVLGAVSLACTFLKGGSANSAYGVGEIQNSPVPHVDDKEPFPAMSTDTINNLVREMPELAKHRESILEAERSALNGIFNEVRARSEYPTDSQSLFLARARVDGNDISQFHLIPAAYGADDPPPVPDMGGLEYHLIGHQAGFFTPDFGKMRDTDLGRTKEVKIKTDTTGEVIAVIATNVGKDGTVTSEISTTINMPVMGLNANSKFKLKGNQCPTADGEIDIAIELSTNGRAGSAGSTIYDKTITAKLQATVNDSAEIATMDFDLKQGTRSTAGGRQVYIETTQAGKSTNGTYEGFSFGDANIVRASSQAQASDAELSHAGLNDDFFLAVGVLENAKARWQGGGCVKIVADSPGTVAVNSTTQIPVKVIHLVDGADVPSKLESALSGGESIEPQLMPKTAGTLSYVAPGETGKSATIKLTATSKRGIAKLDLTAATGGASYQIVGGLDDWHTDSRVCDVMKPFKLTGSYGISMNLSGGLSGTYTYSGQFQTHGSGTYTITLPDGPGKPGKMVGTGPGSAMGHSGSGTENYTLTPIPPCN